MENEQNQTLGVLRIAIQMEVDGKEYYLKASRESSNVLGKELLDSLAAAEETHRRKFEEIYNVIRNKRVWPATDIQLNGSEGLRTILSSTSEEVAPNLKTSSSELDTIQIAMELENKTYDFYRGHGSEATYDTERDFYQRLAAEERGHYLILLDYYEYLKDPSGWFVSKEHPSMDGG